MEQEPVYEQSPKPVSVGDWMITLLITAIPIIGFIMLFVWAFGGGNKISKANWAKAIILWYIILVALFILWYLIGPSIFSPGGSRSGSTVYF